MALRLSSEETRRLKEAQRALLSPLQHQDTDMWRCQSLEATMRLLGADTGALMLPVEGLDLLYAVGHDSRLTSQYSEAVEEDEMIQRAVRRASRLGVASRPMLFPKMDALRRSAYYNEIIRPARAHDSIHANARVPGSPVPASLYLFHDRPDGPRFGHRGIELLRVLRPALEAGVDTVVRHYRAVGNVIAGLEASPHGTFLFDRRGKCIHRNGASKGLASPRDELALIECSGRLADALFGAVEGGATDANVLSGVAMSLATEDRTLRLIPTLVASDGSGEPMVVVTVVSGGGGRRFVISRQVREAAGLTRREAEVASLLAARCTNKEIAKRLGISPHTARRHTENILAKLGLHSRREVRPRLERLVERDEHS